MHIFSSLFYLSFNLHKYIFVICDLWLEKFENLSVTNCVEWVITFFSYHLHRDEYTAQHWYIFKILLVKYGVVRLAHRQNTLDVRERKNDKWIIWDLNQGFCYGDQPSSHDRIVH